MINNIQQVYFIHKIVVVISLILFIYILFGIPKSHDDRKLYIPLIIYSFVALYRSICMTNETEKLCLVKSEFCQPIINRTLATIAETSIGFFTIMIISKIFGVNGTFKKRPGISFRWPPGGQQNMMTVGGFAHWRLAIFAPSGRDDRFTQLEPNQADQLVIEWQGG